MATVRDPKPAAFWCTRCSKTKPIEPTGAPGYARGPDDEKICYACCADIDRAEMVREGKRTLYWTDDDARTGARGTVSNWPGSLKFPITAISKGRHNVAGVVVFLYFTGPDGKPWFGRVVGRNTQLASCRRLKARR